MDKINASWEKDGYLLRPARAEDAEPYYEQNYNPLDPEAARLTGCKPVFTHEEVVGFFPHRCLDDPAGMISCSSPPRGGSSARASSTRSTGSCGRPISASGSSGPPPAGRESAPGWWK